MLVYLRLVHLVRGRERCVGLSILLVYGVDLLAVWPLPPSPHLSSSSSSSSFFTPGPCTSQCQWKITKCAEQYRYQQDKQQHNRVNCILPKKVYTIKNVSGFQVECPLFLYRGEFSSEPYSTSRSDFNLRAPKYFNLLRPSMALNYKERSASYPHARSFVL